MNGRRITARDVLIVLAIVIPLLLVLQIWSTVLMIVIALMFATALNPWVDWLQGHHVARGFGVLILALGTIALGIFFAVVLFPVLAEQFESVLNRFPELQADIANWLRERGNDGAAETVEDFHLTDILSGDALLSVTSGVLGAIGVAAGIGLLTCYFMVDANRVKRFAYFLVPASQHHHLRFLMPSMDHVVGGYIRGQIITSSCIAAFSIVLLTILRVPDALALGVLAFWGDMIPVIGVYVIMVPMVLAALEVSVPVAIVTGVAIGLYTQFENSYLVQKVYSVTLDLPPSAILVGVMVGGELLGVAGALLALPAAATVSVLLQYIYGLRRGTPPMVDLGGPAAAGGDVGPVVGTEG